MRILILDNDNRDIVSLVYHYNMLGHEPCVPAPGTLGYQFSPLWPRVLFKDYNNRKKRIIDDFQFKDDISEISNFGEDRFVNKEWIEKNPVYNSDVGLSFVDVEKEGHTFDAWHTTPNAKSKLPEFFEIAKKYFPKAKWISSSIDHFDHDALGCKNVIKWLPANYVDAKCSENDHYLFRHPFEFEYVNVSTKNSSYNNKMFSSLNHNFSVRHPTHYKIFCDVNETLHKMGKDDLVVTNYGGNIRRHGADIKYSGDSGITGKFMTLSPPEAMRIYVNSCGILHLKQYDWAGGVPSGARIAGCPIIFQNEYVRITKSERYFVDDYNCSYADSVENIVNVIIRLSEDGEYRNKLSHNSYKMNEKIFSDDYWNGWKQFLERLS